MMTASAKIRPLPIPEGKPRLVGGREIREVPPRKGDEQQIGMLLRISKDQRELIKKAARSLNETAAYFALRATLERATKVLQG